MKLDISGLIPSYFLHQGLSDFCSNPDTYVLNLTEEETGLSSGDSHKSLRSSALPATPLVPSPL